MKTHWRPRVSKRDLVQIPTDVHRKLRLQNAQQKRESKSARSTLRKRKPREWRRPVSIVVLKSNDPDGLNPIFCRYRSLSTHSCLGMSSFKVAWQHGACALLFGGFFERGVIHVYKVVSIAYFTPLTKKLTMISSRP